MLKVKKIPFELWLTKNNDLKQLIHRIGLES